MSQKCKLCKGKGPCIYTNIDYKMTPMCLSCYKKHTRKNEPKNDYKKLMNKLASKGYVWVLNIGDDREFPFTFFGLEISFFQIVQYFFKYVDSDKLVMQGQDDCVFTFKDYPDPIITETSITFINEEDGTTYAINIRMGKYNYKQKQLLFFTDKQIGMTASDLSEYLSFLIEDGSLSEIVPDFNFDDENEEEFIEKEPEDFDYEYSKPKAYFDEKDLADLIGYTPQDNYYDY